MVRQPALLFCLLAVALGPAEAQSAPSVCESSCYPPLTTRVRLNSSCLGDCQECLGAPCASNCIQVFIAYTDSLQQYTYSTCTPTCWTQSMEVEGIVGAGLLIVIMVGLVSLSVACAIQLRREDEQPTAQDKYGSGESVVEVLLSTPDNSQAQQLKMPAEFQGALNPSLAQQLKMPPEFQGTLIPSVSVACAVELRLEDGQPTAEDKSARGGSVEGAFATSQKQTTAQGESASGGSVKGFCKLEQFSDRLRVGGEDGQSTAEEKSASGGSVEVSLSAQRTENSDETQKQKQKQKQELPGSQSILVHSLKLSSLRRQKSASGENVKVSLSTQRTENSDETQELPDSQAILVHSLKLSSLGRQPKTAEEQGPQPGAEKRQPNMAVEKGPNPGFEERQVPAHPYKASEDCSRFVYEEGDVCPKEMQVPTNPHKVSEDCSGIVH